MKSADQDQTSGNRDSGETERIRSAGRDAMSDATGEVRTRLERGKSSAADTAATTSEVLDHAAADFSAQGQDTLARATTMLAGKLSSLASQLEQRSLDDLAQDARRLARNNPGLFVAGGVAIGLAMSRFFKASAPGTRHATRSGQWSGGPAYGGEGAVPSPGSERIEPYGSEGTYGTGADYGREGAPAGEPSFGEGAEGPARASSTTGKPLGGDYE
jgi:hypothetical protein